MLLHGRPLRTRLDLLRPDTGRRVKAKQLAQTSNPLTQARQLEIGAKVLARDYRPGTNPWLPGSIATQSQSGLYYEVQVSPGVLWRRHIDQLRSTSIAPVPLEPASEPALVPAQGERTWERQSRNPSNFVISAARTRKCTASIGSTANPHQPCACGTSSCRNYTRIYCRASLSTA